jgi:ribosomal protein L11
MLNADRQKTMVSDADKLLKLAAQLNAEISAANQGELTPAQLKKISEIEKLARKVREKMSTSVRGTAMNLGTYIQDAR